MNDEDDDVPEILNLISDIDHLDLAPPSWDEVLIRVTLQEIEEAVLADADRAAETQSKNGRLRDRAHPITGPHRTNRSLSGRWRCATRG